MRRHRRSDKPGRHMGGRAYRDFVPRIREYDRQGGACRTPRPGIPAPRQLDAPVMISVLIGGPTAASRPGQVIWALIFAGWTAPCE
jgi:hypothetical protein